jgi:hypothetical protein
VIIYLYFKVLFQKSQNLQELGLSLISQVNDDCR